MLQIFTVSVPQKKGIEIIFICFFKKYVSWYPAFSVKVIGNIDNGVMFPPSSCFMDKIGPFGEKLAP